MTKEQWEARRAQLVKLVAKPGWDRGDMLTLALDWLLEDRPIDAAVGEEGLSE